MVPPSRFIDRGIAQKSLVFLVQRFHAEKPVYGRLVAYTRVPVWLPYIERALGEFQGPHWSHVRATAIKVRRELEKAQQALDAEPAPACPAEDVLRVEAVVAALRAQPAAARRAEYARVLKGAEAGTLGGRPGFGLLARWPFRRIVWALETLYWAGVLQVPGEPWWGLLEGVPQKANVIDDDAVVRLFGRPARPDEPAGVTTGPTKRKPPCPIATAKQERANPWAEMQVHETELERAIELGWADELWQVLLAHHDWKVRRAIARSPRPGRPVFDHLSRDAKRDVREALATNPALPAAVVEALAGDPSYFVRRHAGLHAAATDGMLALLAGDESDAVRETVALHRRTPAAVLMKVAARTWDPVVTPALLRHRTLPRDAWPLLEQAAAGSASCRAWVAAHDPRTTKDELSSLSGDRSYATRVEVASRHGCPPQILGRLAGDRDEHVRQAAAMNPDAPAAVLAALASDRSALVREGLGGNPALPAAIADRLADDAERGPRLSLARNVATPPAVFARLAADPASAVRVAVARCPSAPVLLLEALVFDADASVSIAALRHPAVPARARATLAAELASSWRERAKGALTRRLAERAGGTP